jgi:pyruvate kinase
MCLPGVEVKLPTLSPQDEDDLVNFGVKHKVDMISASFVRKPSDVIKIRSVLGEGGKDIKIISKIENREGIENYDLILKESDGIMVARGDMGMEIELEKVINLIINRFSSLKNI